MQLGTNSVDTPRINAVLDYLKLEGDNDIVVAMWSDGVTDNLWEHGVSKVNVHSRTQNKTNNNTSKNKIIIFEKQKRFDPPPYWHPSM